MARGIQKRCLSLLQSSLCFLSESEYWFSNGTFKVFPTVFFQVDTEHAQQRGKIFLCISGLLPNKTEATYIRFYRENFNRDRRQGNNSDRLVNQYFC